ncbi:MAG: hypothetical protein QOK05_1360 [Chloroflexota bacterium]|nr:hypothetical protein [Chloroflexota bacterium]
MELSAGPQPRPQVLLVEDFPPDAELYGRALEQAGIEVTTVTTGAQALELGRDPRFSLLLVDIGLPDMSGLDVLRLLAGETRRTPVPVAIVLTGDDSDRVITGALKLGAAAVLTKVKTSPALLAERVLGWIAEGAAFRAV